MNKNIMIGYVNNQKIKKNNDLIKLICNKLVELYDTINNDVYKKQLEINQNCYALNAYNTLEKYMIVDIEKIVIDADYVLHIYVKLFSANNGIITKELTSNFDLAY